MRPLFFFLGIAPFIFFDSLLLAQAKVVFVLDQTFWKQPVDEAKASEYLLKKGTRLEGNTFLKIPPKMYVVLLLENNIKITLEGPREYQVPEVSWEAVGYLRCGDQKQSLSGGMALNENTLLTVNAGYHLALLDPNQTLITVSGPTEYKIAQHGYHLERYQENVPTILSSRRYSEQKDFLSLKGEIQLRKGFSSETEFPLYPMVPRGTLKSNQNITFSWTPVVCDPSLNPTYVLRVWKGERKKNILLHVQTTENFYVSTSLLLFPEQEYFWQVDSFYINENRKEITFSYENKEFPVSIKLLSLEKQREVKQQASAIETNLAHNPDLVSEWWELIFLYNEYELYTESFSILSQRVQSFGTSEKNIFPAIYKIGVEQLNLPLVLIETYYQLPLKSLAQNYFSQENSDMEWKRYIFQRLAIETSEAK